MAYPVEMLLNVQECSAALAVAEREKSNLNYRIATISREKTEMATSGPAIDQKLAIVNAEILGFQTAYDAAPAGANKTVLWEKLQLSISKQRNLLKRDQDYGNVAIVTIELELTRAQKELNELDTFIGEVTTRKAAL